VLDYVSFLPNAIPSSIFGFSVLIAALYYLQLPFSLDLYGSLALLIIVHVITGISFGTRIVTSGLIQIHSDLESAAKMSGANGWQVARRVIVPMLRPTVVYLWLWLALLIFRELTLATLLVSPDNVTVSVITWNLWSTGQMGQASALNLIMMLVLMPLVAFAWRYGRGDRIGTR
jgi:iron(III) transport system permease protein